MDTPHVTYLIQSPAAAAKTLRRHRIKLALLASAFVAAVLSPSPWQAVTSDHVAGTTQTVNQAVSP